MTPVERPPSLPPTQVDAPKLHTNGNTPQSPPAVPRPTSREPHEPRKPREKNGDFSTPIAVVGILIAVIAVVMALAANQTDRSNAPATKPSAGLANTIETAPAATKDNFDVEAKPFDPATRPIAPGAKTFNLTTKEQRVKVGDKVYTLWTFNNTVPGPTLRAVEGDIITINLTNASSSKMLHSVDFHASRLTMGGGHVQVAPGDTGTFTFKAEYPGVFMYHCATPPVLEHIGRGMYGAIIIQPKEGFGKPMPEYAFVQSELYASFDGMKSGTPSELAFNGIPNQYVNEPIKLKPNTNARVFFLNAGPSQVSSFHIVGTVFDKVLEEGNPANLTVGRQVLTVGASGGAVFEMKFVGEGKFPMVTHQFNHVAQGAVGMFITGDGVPGTGKPAAMDSKTAH